jgi:peptide chain release factor 2
MRAEAENAVAAIRKSLSLVKRRMDWETAGHRLEELNAMTEDPNLWNDAARAQKLMRDRQTLSDAVARVEKMERDLSDNVDLIEMGEAEGDREVVAEAEEALKRLREKAGQAEIEALLDGEADGNDTFLEINAGAGGTESCDWAAMLARMYVRWAEQHGYKVELHLGKLGRRGGHQVGRLQDQRAQRLWLAQVGIGRAPAGAHLALRFGGAAAHLVFLGLGLSGGGRQHRDRHPRQGHPHRHLPVLGRGRPACQHDRLGGADHPPADEHRGDQSMKSQHQNREIAMNALRSRLYQLELDKRNAAINAQHDAKGDAGWGNQIRSYVLQPYQMVKDLRRGRDLGHAGRAGRRSRRLHGGDAGDGRGGQEPGRGRADRSRGP